MSREGQEIFSALLVWTVVVFAWSIVLMKLGDWMQLMWLEAFSFLVVAICILSLALLGTTYLICANQVWPCIPG
jgi:hypothetical protein